MQNKENNSYLDINPKLISFRLITFKQRKTDTSNKYLERKSLKHKLNTNIRFNPMLLIPPFFPVINCLRLQSLAECHRGFSKRRFDKLADMTLDN